ncbi:MAG: PEGA domain-containing protein [Planctomycetota bacterium]
MRTPVHARPHIEAVAEAGASRNSAVGGGVSVRWLAPSMLWWVAAWLAPACTHFQGDARVLVTSTPPGAYILVDGADSGRTTPSMVDLDGIVGSSHHITVRKRGFDDETREVYHYTTAHTARWIDGALGPGLWNLPLWWTLGDWFLPAAVRWRYVPHELHVRLYPEGEGPVSTGGGTPPP